MALKYEIIIWWSDEDDAFIVDVPELPGCTAYGPTYADAAREIQVAMGLWVDIVEEFGMDVPEPMGKRLEFSYIWHSDEKLSESGMSRKYEMVIYWSDEDEAFLAEVPDLPGCVADGRTYEEAVAEAQVVMDEWIESAEILGREIPEPRTQPHFVGIEAR